MLLDVCKCMNRARHRPKPATNNPPAKPPHVPLWANILALFYNFYIKTAISDNRNMKSREQGYNLGPNMVERWPTGTLPERRGGRFLALFLDFTLCLKMSEQG